MTTKITIENDATSNGDVLIRTASTWSGHAAPNKPTRLFPGQKAEVGITDMSLVVISEEWPTQKPMPEGTG